MELDFVVIVVGIMYYLIGSFINKENAKIFLAGYNTMSNSERKKFDIDGYLNFFKPLFKKLGFYSVIIFYITSFILDLTTTVWIWFIAQIIPLIYIAIYGNSFKKNSLNFSKLVVC